VIARPLFRSLSRPLFRALSGAVSAITKVLIDLSPTSNGFYSLGTPIVFAADFEVELDFVSALGTNEHITGAVSGDRYEIQFLSNDNLLVFDSSIDTVVLDIAGAAYRDLKLHAIKITRVGGLQSFFVDGTNVGSGTFSVGPATIDCFGTRERATLFFEGIISDVKLTDITTPANSLEFELNKLTDNFEYPVGNVFGSEEVTNGDFVSNITGWSNMNAAKGTITWQATQRLRNTVDATFDAGASTGMLNAVGLHQVTMNIFCSVQSNILIRASGGGFPIFFQGILNAGNNVIFKTAVLPFANMTLEVRYSGAAESVGDYFEIYDVSVKSITNIVNYQNIGTGTSVRDTYTLINDDYFGSELVVNGDFATNSDWTLSAGVTISGGKLNITTPGSQSSAEQSSVFFAGVTYEATFVISGYVAGRVLFYQGNNFLQQALADGEFTVVFTADSSGGSLLFRAFSNNPFEGSVDNVSVKRKIEVE
jgi:hypothetical protein